MRTSIEIVVALLTSLLAGGAAVAAVIAGAARRWPRLRCGGWCAAGADADGRWPATAQRLRLARKGRPRS